MFPNPGGRRACFSWSAQRAAKLLDCVALDAMLARDPDGADWRAARPELAERYAQAGDASLARMVAASLA